MPNSLSKCILCLAFLLSVATLECLDRPYRVIFEGNADAEALQLLKSTSQLVALQDTPTVSEAAFKRRIQEDISTLLKALQSLAYYESEIEADVQNAEDNPTVCLNVDTGPIYVLTS